MSCWAHNNIPSSIQNTFPLSTPVESIINSHWAHNFPLNPPIIYYLHLPWEHLICIGKQRNKEILADFWGRATQFPFLPKLRGHPPSFFAEWWKMADRSRHTTSFFAEIPRVKNGREVAPSVAMAWLENQKSMSQAILGPDRTAHVTVTSADLLWFQVMASQLESK